LICPQLVLEHTHAAALARQWAGLVIQRHLTCSNIQTGEGNGSMSLRQLIPL
jgi:hypothetical protein